MVHFLDDLACLLIWKLIWKVHKIIYQIVIAVIATSETIYWPQLTLINKDMSEIGNSMIWSLPYKMNELLTFWSA